MSDTDSLISPFLFSNFRPVKDEIHANNLVVEGVLPEEANGLYMRIGPNPFFQPVQPYHWFDGDGMIHVINLGSPNSASYLNRYIQTTALQIDKDAGRAVNTGLRHPPDMNITLNGGMPYRNTANTSVLYHHGHAFALCEFGSPYEISLPDAETLGPVNLGAHSGMAFNAHPKIDPSNGELLYLKHRLGISPYLCCGCLDKDGALRYETELDVPYPCMMHDFTFTPHVIILMTHSLYFDIKRAKAGKPAWVFNPDIPAQFGILPRGAEGTQIRWFNVSSCCVTHFVNAYEKDDEIVISGIRYQALPEMLAFAAPSEQNASYRTTQEQSGLYEWRLNMTNGTVKESMLHSGALEFPTLHPALYGKPFRYTYLLTEGVDSGLAKYDNVSGTLTICPFGRGRYGGEATFIPRLNARDEDDGYLLVIVWDRTSGLSELLVLDAAGFSEIPLARVFLPVRVPFGFHASFLSKSFLKTGE